MALPMWGYYMKKVYADKSLKINPGEFEAPDKYRASGKRSVAVLGEDKC